MLVDTHCHLYHDRLAGDLDDVVLRAREAGVARILQPAIDLPSIEKALQICDRFEGVLAMAGLHPSETANTTEGDFYRIAAYCDDPRVVAVGESGLDYYWDRSFVAKQGDALRFQARLAIETDLPLVLHNRDKQGSTASSVDLVRILQEERDSAPAGKRLHGVFHCFGGDRAFARSVLDLGFHVGIGGTLTFRNSGVAEAIAEVPLERIVLETDAPFLAPTPHRGTRNEPAYTRLVAETLATLREIPFEEVASVTTSTAKALFRL